MPLGDKDLLLIDLHQGGGLYGRLVYSEEAQRPVLLYGRSIRSKTAQEQKQREVDRLGGRKKMQERPEKISGKDCAKG